jgi:hypothetical protein
VQLDWDLELGGHRLFGNAGIRTADTFVQAEGMTTNVTATGPRPLVATNEYSDDLPSMNVAFEITDDLLIRGGYAKVMSRPLLNFLSPTISQITTPTVGEHQRLADHRQSVPLAVPGRELRPQPRVVLLRWWPGLARLVQEGREQLSADRRERGVAAGQS